MLPLAPELAKAGFALVVVALFAASSWHVRRAIRAGRARVRVRFSASLRERNANSVWLNIGSSLLALGLGSFLLDRYLLFVAGS